MGGKATWMTKKISGDEAETKRVDDAEERGHKLNSRTDGISNILASSLAGVISAWRMPGILFVRNIIDDDK
jgi:hypothetical protein